MQTYVAKARSQLEEAGYTFTKDASDWWVMKDGEEVLHSERQLGRLLLNVTEQLGLEV